MGINVRVDLSKLGPTAKRNLVKPLEKNLKTFFRENESIQQLRFSATAVGTGVTRDQLVQHKPTRVQTQASGVPVGVWIEGRQAVFGVLSCKSVSNEKLLDELIDVETETVTQSKHTLVHNNKEQEVTEANTVSIDNPATSTVVTRVPESKSDKVKPPLLKDDAEAVKIFYFLLLDEFCPSKTTGTVFIPSVTITERACEHLGLTRGNGAMIGNFYRARIFPLGNKSEHDGVAGWELSIEKLLAATSDVPPELRSTSQQRPNQNSSEVAKTKTPKQDGLKVERAKLAAELSKKESTLTEIDQLIQELERKVNQLQTKYDETYSEVQIIRRQIKSCDARLQQTIVTSEESEPAAKQPRKLGDLFAKMR